jgi:hypothetical protein
MDQGPWIGVVGGTGLHEGTWDLVLLKIISSSIGENIPQLGRGAYETRERMTVF